MRIDHVAIECNKSEEMKEFYSKVFELKVSNKYENVKKNFISYFLYFDDNISIELMNSPKSKIDKGDNKSHFSIGVNSEEEVDKVVDKIRKYKKAKVTSEARFSGLGDYVACIEDIEGNYIEVIYNKRIFNNNHYI